MEKLFNTHFIDRNSTIQTPGGLLDCPICPLGSVSERYLNIQLQNRGQTVRGWIENTGSTGARQVGPFHE